MEAENRAVAARDWQDERRRKWRVIRLWPFVPEGWEMGRDLHLSLLSSYRLSSGCRTAKKGGGKICLTWPDTWIWCGCCCSQTKMNRLPLSLSIEGAAWLGPLVGSLSCPVTQFSEDANSLRSFPFQMLVGLSQLKSCLWSPWHLSESHVPHPDISGPPHPSCLSSHHFSPSLQTLRQKRQNRNSHETKDLGSCFST